VVGIWYVLTENVRRLFADEPAPMADVIAADPPV